MKWLLLCFLGTSVRSQTVNQRRQHEQYLCPYSVPLSQPQVTASKSYQTRLQESFYKRQTKTVFFSSFFAFIILILLTWLHHLLYFADFVPTAAVLSDSTSGSLTAAPPTPFFLLLLVWSVSPPPVVAAAAAFSGPMRPPAGVSSPMLSLQSRCTKYSSLQSIF